MLFHIDQPDLRDTKIFGIEEVAEQLQLSTPAYSKIETGITDINLSRLVQISELFEISLVELLTDDEKVSGYREKVEPLMSRLADLNMEVFELQKKVIELYGEISKVRAVQV